LVKAAQRLDSRPGLVATAEFLRRILPGDREYGDALTTAGGELPQHLGRLVSELRLERPSAFRELGLGALQAWPALSESQRPRRIGRDYLGVDVNIAARVADAAQAGEVLVSDPACASLEPAGFELGRSRRLEAQGAPKELSVCTVTARA